MEENALPQGSRARLLGTLVGLARGMEGSEHLITPWIAQTAAACLTARGGDALMEDLLKKVLEIKGRILPGCMVCANPCGKTNPYDLNRLLEEPEEIRNGKLALLAAAEELAECPRNRAGDLLLLQCLLALGTEEIDVEAMNSLLESVKTAVSSYC